MKWWNCDSSAVSIDLEIEKHLWMDFAVGFQARVYVSYISVAVTVAGKLKLNTFIELYSWQEGQTGQDKKKL